MMHLKGSSFHACYRKNSFLTLITSNSARAKCSLLKLISHQGLLSENSHVPSYHLWSAALRGNLLWINCEYHLPKFRLDMSLVLTQALTAFSREHLIMVHIYITACSRSHFPELLTNTAFPCEVAAFSPSAEMKRPNTNRVKLLLANYRAFAVVHIAKHLKICASFFFSGDCACRNEWMAHMPCRCCGSPQQRPLRS